MARKSLICGLAIIILSLCCGFCFAADGNSSINLGNEIMQSIDKTGASVQNVISGNIVGDTANTVRKGVDNVGNAVKDTTNNINNGFDNGMNNDNNGKDKNNGVITDTTGNYNATKTMTDATTTTQNGFNTMTTTTWMWIILVVAAIIIVAAIWYYATQNNS